MIDKGRKIINLVLLSLLTCLLLFFTFFYPFAKADKKAQVKEQKEKVQQESTRVLNVKKDFFIEYRLDRERLRSQQTAFLEEIVRDPSLDGATKKEINERILKLNEVAQGELNIENMVKARGYKDAVAIVHENYVDVIIHGSALFSSDIQSIGEIVVKNTGVSLENVIIMSKP